MSAKFGLLWFGFLGGFNVRSAIVAAGHGEWWLAVAAGAVACLMFAGGWLIFAPRLREGIR